MLGSFRLLLALLVVMAHLAEGITFVSHMGVFAVFGFYVISGYLMTLVLHEVYHFNFSSFWANRFLRLFPTYYLVALASLLVVIHSPSAAAYHPAWSVPPNVVDWLGNLLMVPFEFYHIDRSFRLVPPTWSIAVELINYFILWAVVARSALMTGLAFVGALAYHIVSLKFGQHWSARFVPSYAALLPFAAGAAIYFVRKSVHCVPSSIPLLAASGLGWLVNLLMCGALGGTSGSYFGGFFYANVVAVTIFIFLSASLSFDSLKAFDKGVGDLAYPVFLVHWLVGYFIASTILPGQRRGLELLAYSLPVILLVSMGLAWIARQCLEPARDRIRNRHTASSDGKA